MDGITAFALLYPKVSRLQQLAISGLLYKGSITSPTQSAPSSKSEGDLYLSNTEGILVNFGNVSVSEGDGVIWDGTQWTIIKYSSLVNLKSDYIIIDKFSSLTSQTKNKIAYVINDEVISNIKYKKGFYLYDVTTNTWNAISGDSDFVLNQWKPNTKFEEKAYAVYDYKLYQCLVTHVSSNDFNDDLQNDNWELIIGNDSFAFKQWTSGENYLKDEYVVFDYKLYKTNVDINGDIDFDETKYDLIIGSENRYQPWESGKSYVVGDKVEHDSRYYECIADHTATIFDDDKDNWIEILEIYYSLKQAQYDDMVANGLITDDNKHLYVIEDGVGESSSYEENITTPTDPWIIQHNLKAPYYKLDITCLDNDGDFVYGEVDTTLSTQNLLVINFGTAIAGKVYLTIK